MAVGIKNDEPDAKVLYADIIDLPHWRSEKHEHMTPLERAAQFSPFAALTGYEDMIDEEAREVGSMISLTDTEMEVLNQKISLIADTIENGQHPVVCFTYFLPDVNKVGGSYVSITERVRRVDTVGKKIQLFKKTGLSGSYMELDMDRIQDISGSLVDFIE